VDRQAAGAPRIGVVRFLWAEASAAMQNAVESAAAAGERAGAQVADATLPPIVEEAWRIHPTIQDYEAWRALAFEYDPHRDAIPPATRARLGGAAAIAADDYAAARRPARLARRALADLMRDHDVLLTPPAPGAAPRGLGPPGSPTFNRLWTLMGTPT